MMSGVYLPLIKPANYILVGLSAVASMDIHGECVQLLERGHGAEEKNDQTPAFHCLYGTGQEVRSQGLKVLEGKGEKMEIYHTATARL